MCELVVNSLQHINELTMKLDLQSVLRGAEAIYLQLTQCKVREASWANKIQHGGQSICPYFVL